MTTSYNYYVKAIDRRFLLLELYLETDVYFPST